MKPAGLLNVNGLEERLRKKFRIVDILPVYHRLSFGRCLPREKRWIQVGRKRGNPIGNGAVLADVGFTRGPHFEAAYS